MYDPLNIYRGRYKEFIEGIMKERPLNEVQECNEKHHIVPRCTYNDKGDFRINDSDNLINLNPREHLIAHKILAEDNIDNHKLVCAYLCMSRWGDSTPEDFEESAKLFSKTQSSYMKGNKFATFQTEESRKNSSERFSSYLKDNHPSKNSEIIKKREVNRLNTIYSSVKVCPLCGKEFHPNSSFRKYCSTTCKDIAHIIKNYLRQGYINSKYKIYLQEYSEFVNKERINYE